MEKRKVALIIAIIGILLIIFSAIVIKLQKNVKEKDTSVLKAVLLSDAKKCLEDKVCTTDNILITTLIENNYVSEENKVELENYTNDSFIDYKARTVYLIEKVRS